MTTPPDRDGSRSPRVEPAPSVVLVYENCDHIWEPSPDELDAGPVPCTQCEGWTTIAELATTTEEPALLVIPLHRRGSCVHRDPDL